MLVRGLPITNYRIWQEPQTLIWLRLIYAVGGSEPRASHEISEVYIGLIVLLVPRVSSSMHAHHFSSLLMALHSYFPVHCPSSITYPSFNPQIPQNLLHPSLPPLHMPPSLHTASPCPPVVPSQLPSTATLPPSSTTSPF